MLTSDGPILAVADKATGHSVRLEPARLYHYSYDRPLVADAGRRKAQSVKGVAALDADGLVMLDLPGEWRDLPDFAGRAGIPLVDARGQDSERVRALLASRAPGWQRVRGLPEPSLAGWRKPVAIGAGVAGLGVMAYLASSGMWGAWYGLSSLGRMLLDLLDAKWLVMAFSPALLVLRPVLARTHRWQVKRGAALGPVGGPCLSRKPGKKLQVIHGNEVIAQLRTGEVPGRAFSLLIYRYDDLTGLFILDRTGCALHHLPGRWSAEDAERFAKRHGLLLAVHRVTREEYVQLTTTSKEATP
ncbi:hypothetical protein ITP53_42635 [Nonomuraea sp. K274]|uniref:Uncharacterized protein n=1 Tax=Nonomuraea cypriaca TaxID=1187855 RepID=A0A931AIF2_9ACTN|nr:hypothetical protein [Nonomuraea cypriaca]MBF8192270.1 hypothetical protein [Nonomuraea cypriaca]